MDWLTQELIGFVSSQNNPIGLAIILASALVEYIFPPFPGDTVTLLGATLITGYGWSFAGVFAAVMIGSVGGSMIDFWIGVRWRRRRLRRVTEAAPAPGSSGSEAIDALVRRFEKYGAAYLVLNRFLPGIRALFFVAAGMAAMRPAKVLVYSAISSALWNLGLIALGAAVGANFETLLAWIQTYTAAVWIILGAIVVLIVGRWLWRRRRRRRAAP